MERRQPCVEARDRAPFAVAPGAIAPSTASAQEDVKRHVRGLRREAHVKRSGEALAAACVDEPAPRAGGQAFRIVDSADAMRLLGGRCGEHHPEARRREQARRRRITSASATSPSPRRSIESSSIKRRTTSWATRHCASFGLIAPARRREARVPPSDAEHVALIHDLQHVPHARPRVDPASPSAAVPPSARIPPWARMSRSSTPQISRYPTGGSTSLAPLEAPRNT